MFVAQQAKIRKKSLISNLVFEKLYQKDFALILRILEPLCMCVCVCATITNFSKVFTWMEPKLAFVLVEVLDRVKSLTKKNILH